MYHFFKNRYFKNGNKNKSFRRYWNFGT